MCLYIYVQDYVILHARFLQDVKCSRLRYVDTYLLIDTDIAIRRQTVCTHIYAFLDSVCFMFHIILSQLMHCVQRGMRYTTYFKYFVWYMSCLHLHMSHTDVNGKRCRLYHVKSMLNRLCNM